MSTGRREAPPESLLILGTLAGGKLAFWTVRDTWPSAVVAFVDDTLGSASISIGGVDYPVIEDWNFDEFRARRNQPAMFREFIVGAGHPEAKRVLVGKALAAGLSPAPTVIHPRAFVLGDDCSIGRGGVMSPFSLIASGSIIGDYVHLAPNAIVGHDCRLGARVTCNPGSNVAGFCELGDGVTIGAGATVRERTRIAAGVTVGAQSCVVRDVLEENAIVVGVPAAPLRPR